MAATPFCCISDCAHLKEAENKCNDIFKKYDKNKDGSISLSEFQSFVSKDPDIVKLVYNYGLISVEDLRIDFGPGGADGMPDCDSDIENEVNKATNDFDERIENIKNGIEHGLQPDDEQEPAPSEVKKPSGAKPGSEGAKGGE